MKNSIKYLQNKVSLKMRCKDICYLLPSIFWIITMTIVTYLYSNKLVNSDAASSLILAREMADENNYIMTPNYYYGTELPILSFHFITIILFKLFPNWSWSAIRSIRGLILEIFLLFLFNWSMGTLKLNKKYIKLASMFLFIPYSNLYYEMLHGGGYFYLPHCIMVFLIMGIFLKLSSKIKLSYFILFFLLAFLSGIQSIRSLLICWMPLAATSIFMLYCHSIKSEEKMIQLKNLKSPNIFFACGGFIVSFFAYFFCEKVLHQSYYFISYGYVTLANWENTSLFKRLSEIVTDIFAFFGWENTIPIKSINGVRSLFSIVCFAILLFLIYVFVKERKKFEDKEIFFVVFLSFSFLINTFSFIFSEGAYTIRYYVPILILFVPLIPILISKSLVHKEINRIFILVLCVGMNIFGICILHDHIQHEENTYKIQACEYLKENNLNFGYASYWNANVMTELSDGKINVVSTIFPDFVPHIILMPKRYLQETILDTVQTSNIFLLLTADEYESSKNNPILQQTNCVYNDGVFLIFLYDKYEFWDIYNRSVLKRIGSSVKLTSSKSILPIYSGYEQENEQWISKQEEGFLVFGPYSSIEAGTYEISFCFDYSGNLPTGTPIGFVDVISQENIFIQKDFIVGDNHITFSGIKLDENYDSFETRIYTYYEGVVFNYISITKTGE